MEILLPKAAEIGALLRARGETVAVAESSSGGLICAALLAVPGASAYVRGGGVIYTKQARAGLVGIGEFEMRGIRSASEDYARLLARTLRVRLEADWGLAETGAAGPRGNAYGDAPGHTCLAVSGRVERVVTLETGVDDRVENMRRFGMALLTLFAEVLDAEKAGA